eukprot:741512-Prorocentrum_minimum.AAC.3
MEGVREYYRVSVQRLVFACTQEGILRGGRKERGSRRGRSGRQRGDVEMGEGRGQVSKNRRGGLCGWALDSRVVATLQRCIERISLDKNAHGVSSQVYWINKHAWGLTCVAGAYHGGGGGSTQLADLDVVACQLATHGRLRQRVAAIGCL